MRKIIFTSLATLISTFLVYSQGPKIRFGKITEEELTMKYYEQDSSAEAAVLFDKGEVKFYYNNYENPKHFQFEYKRFLRIKIFNKMH